MEEERKISLAILIVFLSDYLRWHVLYVCMGKKALRAGLLIFESSKQYAALGEPGVSGDRKRRSKQTKYFVPNKFGYAVWSFS